MAGAFKLRPYACLLVAYLFERTGQRSQFLWAFQQFGQHQVALLHLGLHLGNGKVVGLAHEEQDELVHLVVVTGSRRILAQGVGHDHSLLHFFGMIQSEGHTLQPHHAAEVALQGFAAGVVATGTEQTVGKRHLAVVGHELTGLVFRRHRLLHLGLCLGLLTGIGYLLTRQQLVGHGEVDGIVVSQLAYLLAAGILGLVVHGLIHVERQLGHQPVERVLLQFAQHAVEVQVVELQEEVGSHKRGEARVVVLLVNVEQLLMAGRHNGKAVLRQLLAEQRVELLELRGVQQVLHVYAQPFGHSEVLLGQLVLAGLQALHEVQLLGGVLHESGFLAGTVVVVAPRLVLALFNLSEVGGLIEHIRQRVVPGGCSVDAAQIGVLEGIALTGCGRITQDAEVAQTEARHIHVVVNVLVQLLHVDMRHGDGNLNQRLFLTARGHEAGNAQGKESLCLHRLKYLIAVSWSVF